MASQDARKTEITRSLSAYIHIIYKCIKHTNSMMGLLLTSCVMYFVWQWRKKFFVLYCDYKRIYVYILFNNSLPIVRYLVTAIYILWLCIYMYNIFTGVFLMLPHRTELVENLHICMLHLWQRKKIIGLGPNNSIFSYSKNLSYERFRIIIIIILLST